MSQNLQQHITNKTNKQKNGYLDISNNDLTGNADLKEFTALTSLNAYNNKLESIEFLNSLPNKEKLTSLNFFGNQIQELDLAWLLKTFPNLKKVNCGNNPLRAKNLLAKAIIKNWDKATEQEKKEIKKWWKETYREF